MSWPIMFLSIKFDDMSWPMIIDGISLAFMFEIILPWPIKLVYIVWSIMLDVMLWPSILEGIFRPIMFEGIPWVITSEDLCIEGIRSFLALMLDKGMSCPIMLVDMSRPIILVDMSRPIRFGIPWFIMSDNLYKEDIWPM